MSGGLESGHTGFSLNPSNWVPGRVEEPDDAHERKIEKSYSLTVKQVEDLLQYVDSKRGANYNLFKYNCTTFAVECAEAAGQSAPAGAMQVLMNKVCLPNALYRDLYQMHKKGDNGVKVQPLGKNERHE